MEFQVQTNWCWAAVATSVDAYYRHGTGAPMPMCEVANSELGRTDCCTTGAAGPCNVYGTLASALFRVGTGQMGLQGRGRRQQWPRRSTT